MMESSVKEDDTKVLTTTTEASIEEAEYITRPSEHLQRQMLRCLYGLRALVMAAAAAAAE